MYNPETITPLQSLTISEGVWMEEVKLSVCCLTGLNNLKVFLLHIRRIRLFQERNHKLLSAQYQKKKTFFYSFLQLI